MVQPPERLPLAQQDLRPETLHWFQELGVRPLTTAELDASFARTLQAIQQGTTHPNGATEAAGGGGAYVSFVHPLGPDLTLAVPQDMPVAVFNCGGVNWQAGEAYVNRDSQLQVATLAQATFAQDADRQFANPEAFVRKMIELYLTAQGKAVNDLPTVVGIALGFRFQALETPLGLDAVLPEDEISKHWHVSSIAHAKLGEIFRLVARQEGWGIEKLFVTNDAIANSCGVANACYGLTAGGGTGGALSKPRENDGYLVNIEPGRLTTFPQTELITQLMRTGQLPDSNGQQLAEYFSGGDYLVRSLIQLVRYLDRTIASPSLAPALATQNDSRLVSLFANGGEAEWQEALAYLQLSSLPIQDRVFLYQASQNFLARTGQVLGTLLGAMIAHGENGNPRLPLFVAFEGSVGLKGEGVKQTMEQTLRHFFGPAARLIALQESSAFQGIGRLALQKGQRDLLNRSRVQRPTKPQR